MKLRIMAMVCGFLGVFLSTNAQAIHINYMDYSDIGINNPLLLSAGDTYEYTFDLTTDAMELTDIETATYLGIGSYDPATALHYSYLRIDPNNMGANAGSLEVLVNGNVIGTEWLNPITLYDWGIPGAPIYDPYGVAAANYRITVGFNVLDDIEIRNINLEGCFDSATPVPEPATMLLFGSGIAGLAGARLRRKRTVS